jgi:hypothetical protein
MKTASTALQLLSALGVLPKTVFVGARKASKSPSHTKKGPGRKHSQGG